MFALLIFFFCLKALGSIQALLIPHRAKTSFLDQKWWILTESEQPNELGICDFNIIELQKAMFKVTLGLA